MKTRYLLCEAYVYNLPQMFKTILWLQYNHPHFTAELTKDTNTLVSNGWKRQKEDFKLL